MKNNSLSSTGFDPVFMQLLATLCRQEFMKDMPIEYYNSFWSMHPSRQAFNFLIRPSQRSRALDWTLKIYQAVNKLCEMIEKVLCFTELLAALATLATLEAELKDLVGQGVREVLNNEFPMIKGKKRKRGRRDRVIYVFINCRFWAVKNAVCHIQEEAEKTNINRVELCIAARDLGRALVFIKDTCEDLKRTYSD